MATLAELLDACGDSGTACWCYGCTTAVLSTVTGGMTALRAFLATLATMGQP